MNCSAAWPANATAAEWIACSSFAWDRSAISSTRCLRSRRFVGRRRRSKSTGWWTPSIATSLSLVPILTGIVTLADRTAGAWLRTRRELKARRYDIAVDFQGLIKSAAFARLSGAKRVLGFERSALRERAASFFYTERFRLAIGQHVIEKNLASGRRGGRGRRAARVSDWRRAVRVDRGVRRGTSSRRSRS